MKDRLNIKDIEDLEESDSESSSEEEEEWNPENEKAFFKTLACLKQKDPKIYTEQFGFFKYPLDGKEVDEKRAKKTNEKSKIDKPYTVRDHERKMIMEKNGQLSDSEDDEDTNEKKMLPKSYNEELASIKTELSEMAKDIDSSDEESDLLGSKLLKKREINVDDEKKDQEEYRLWLKGELSKIDSAKMSKEDLNELKFLKESWSDDKLDEGEKFLRDYILNKKYIDPLKPEKNYIPSYNEIVHDDDELSNDERFETEREEFEHKYNFRYEEPDQDFVSS